ncbi:amidohydrolase [Halovenus salina]|uniref:amidohydrolase n=1 Tax=Halovenus salina TaxID=1510225 RepID=UPI0022609462|nr:amidohydrolase [Halovenus salina]
MTQAADRIFTNAAVHPLTAEDSGEPTAEAVAVREGTIVRVDSAYEVEFLNGVETEVIDLEGQTLLPGFIDAHTHMDIVGRYVAEADLSGTTEPEACLDLLADQRDESEGWILGFGYDESAWGGDYLTRDQLDSVSTDRPVVAYREDLHLASVNSVVLDEYLDQMPADDVHTDDGEPTGVVVEDALDVLREETAPGPEGMREYLLAAQAEANSLGITGVHDMVRNSPAPRVYRELDQDGELSVRVRINYWSDHLDAVIETGLRTNHGTDRVRVGGIKTFTDGSIGGRTAKLSTPYADAPEEDGSWVVDPETVQNLVERVDDAGLQMTVHAIGDSAIEATLDVYEGTDGERHRIEHAEVLRDDLIDRLAREDVVVSAQPNFLKWARSGGLYTDRLGDERREASNRFGTLLEEGATLAFGSDCMPMDPLFGVAQVVDGPTAAQSLSVTEALRAYTAGGAYAGFDEDRLGTIETGNCADFAVLDESPWESNDIADIDVALTVVDGETVYDDRE